MADIKFNLEDNSLVFKEALDEALATFLIEASGEVVSQTARSTPVDNGQLKGSWQAKVLESEGKAIIGSPLENALWNEFGTGEYAVSPEKAGRKTPWYVPVENYKGRKKPSFDGKVVIVYGKDGKKFFKTNGKKPQRSLQKGFDRSKGAIIKRASQEFGSQLKAVSKW